MVQTVRPSFNAPDRGAPAQTKVDRVLRSTVNPLKNPSNSLMYNCFKPPENMKLQAAADAMGREPRAAPIHPFFFIPV